LTLRAARTPSIKPSDVSEVLQFMGRTDQHSWVPPPVLAAIESRPPDVA
jgi:hypothetical protein